MSVLRVPDIEVEKAFHGGIDGPEDEAWAKAVRERIARRRAAKGGPGSGHHGHRGRPGKRGGSLPRGAGTGNRLDFVKPLPKSHRGNVSKTGAYIRSINKKALGDAQDALKRMRTAQISHAHLAEERRKIRAGLADLFADTRLEKTKLDSGQYAMEMVPVYESRDDLPPDDQVLWDTLKAREREISKTADELVTEIEAAEARMAEVHVQANELAREAVRNYPLTGVNIEPALIEDLETELLNLYHVYPEFTDDLGPDLVVGASEFVNMAHYGIDEVNINLLVVEDSLFGGSPLEPVRNAGYGDQHLVMSRTMYEDFMEEGTLELGAEERQDKKFTNIASSVAHEFGHWLEDKSKAIRDEALGIWSHRAGGTPREVDKTGVLMENWRNLGWPGAGKYPNMYINRIYDPKPSTFDNEDVWGTEITAHALEFFTYDGGRTLLGGDNSDEDDDLLLWRHMFRLLNGQQSFSYR